jgi:Domain of unknown function (DUF1707)
VPSDFPPADGPAGAAGPDGPGGPPRPGEPVGPGAVPEVRASDADRDRVLDVLRDAAADGRLTVDEFDQRMEAALSSRTLGQLAALTADLGPGPSPVPARPTGPGVATGPVKDVIRIDQRGGSVQRADRWAVPRRLELRAAWCDVTLDFTDAVIAHDTLRIDLNMRGGSLVLVTRPGVVVDADTLRVRYTDVGLYPGPDPGAPVVLRVSLAGRMRYGRIETRWR